jgi:hypothetical protein
MRIRLAGWALCLWLAFACAPGEPLAAPGRADSAASIEEASDTARGSEFWTRVDEAIPDFRRIYREPDFKLFLKDAPRRYLLNWAFSKYDVSLLAQQVGDYRRLRNEARASGRPFAMVLEEDLSRQNLVAFTRAAAPLAKHWKLALLVAGGLFLLRVVGGFWMARRVGMNFDQSLGWVLFLVFLPVIADFTFALVRWPALQRYKDEAYYAE